MRSPYLEAAENDLWNQAATGQELSGTSVTHPARFAGRLDRNGNLGVSLSTILPTVEGGHPEGVNMLLL